MSALRPISGLLAATLLLPVLSGCGSLDEAMPDQRLAYKKQREAGVNLEIPPDLISGRFNDALDVPASQGVATYSDFAGGRERRQAVAATGSGAVLPDMAEVQLKRDGAARWLEVKASPTQTWNSVLAFWREQGIVLVEQDPAIGLMRTDWLDNRAEIRRDFVTRMISKVAEGLYATSTRDQYSLRLDKIAGGAATEIHLTHRGMEETLAENAVGGVSRTVWEPSGRDTEKEAEMLRRLMVYLGASRDAAQAVSAAPSTTASAPLARLDESAGIPVLLIEQSERRAWRLSGAALDRAGFTVEDRDQSAGLFFVRYAGDRNGGVSDDERKGFASRLAFWRSKKSDGIDGVRQYRIQLEGDERATRLQVLDAEGRPASSEEARRILGLIQQEMR